MEDIAHRLTELGYRRTRPEPECWRVTQIGAPAPATLTKPPREPAESRALARWRRLLSDRREAAPYQICLAMHIAAAGRQSALG